MKSFLIPLNFYPYYRLPNPGEINLLNAQAQVEYETARKQNILNQLLWTEIFFKMRETNREYRKKEEEALNKKPLTKERIKELARKASPRRLTEKEFNSATGKIYYPIVLTDSIFNEDKQNLNIFVEKFINETEKQYQTYEDAQKAINKLQELLKENVSNYESGLYGKASSFLKSLEHELRLLV